MFTNVINAAPANLSTAPTLGELRTQIRTDQSLPELRRREMASALKCVAKALDLPIDSIPADPVSLRAGMSRLTAAMAGVTPGRWRNVQSLTSAALAHAGIVMVQGRIRQEPSAKWLVVLGLLGQGVGRQYHLWRFARYCTTAGIEPDAVNDAILRRYEQDLTSRSLVSEPKRAAREVARAWNATMAQYPTWPQQALTIPDNRNIFAPSFDAYPETLQKQIEQWFARLTNPRRENGRPWKPLKKASVDGFRRHLKAYLGALVVSGIEPSMLVDLRSVVIPARAEIALNYFYSKADDQPTAYTFKQASIVLMIARHEAKLSDTEIAELKEIADGLKPEGGRMTERNIAKLHQLDDPQKMQKLLLLPSTLIDSVRRTGEPSVRTAQKVQTAAIIEVLLHIPLRIANVRGLRLGMHIKTDSKGGLRITIPANEVKNKTPIDAPLTRHTSELLNDYIRHYRPLLVNGRSDYLIPGNRPDTAKCEQAVRSQIQLMLANDVGIDFNPHAFRHLAAYIILKENPTAHGLVQRLLGHKSLHATMTFYSGLETGAVIKYHDELLDRLREGRMSGSAKMKKGAR
jgi:integrase